MRLAIINHHGRKPSGSEISLMRYVGLLPEDIEPIFFLFEEGGFADLVRERYKAIHVPMSAKIANSTRSAYSISSALDVLSLVTRLGIAMKREEIDVVMTNSVKAHFIGMLAAKWTGLPTTVYLHDNLQGNSRRILSMLAKTCSRTQVACSKRTADSLSMPTTKVLYSPVELYHIEQRPTQSAARAALGLPDDGLPIAGLIGRIARWKGHDRFIRIAGRVLKKVDCHFAVIGDPIFGCDEEYPGELRALIDELDIRSRTHFVPWQDDLAPVYSSLDIACNCSNEEPFGRTTIEAMAAGLPVVCFEDAGVSEIFEDGVAGFKIPLYNEDIFAQRVSSLVDSPKMREAFASAARTAAEQMQASRLMPTFERAIRDAYAAPGQVLQPT